MKKILFVWKNNRRLGILSFLFWFSGHSIQAQVMIGNTGNPQTTYSLLEISTTVVAGLRLPQLSETEKNALGVFSGDSLARGLTIYNIGPGKDSIQYWNNTEWIALADGGGKSWIKAAPYFIEVDAGDKNWQNVTITSSCATGGFQYWMVVGNDYCELNPASSGGQFSVRFKTDNPNAGVSARMAIVLVTDNCDQPIYLVVKQKL